VPVVDDDGNIVNIISQSFLSSFVYRYRNKSPYDEALSRPLGFVGTHPVIAVKADTPVSECLETLDSNHLTGMPILDANGRVVGNFSGTDLRYYLKEPTNDKLELGALEYITKNRNSRPKHAPGFGRPAVVSLLPTDSIVDAVAAIAEHKIHRVYIDGSSDDDGPGDPDRFLSVLSIVDLIRILIHDGESGRKGSGDNGETAPPSRRESEAGERGRRESGHSRLRSARESEANEDEGGAERSSGVVEHGRLASLHI
jgi:CBS domain-containing protein